MPIPTLYKCADCVLASELAVSNLRKHTRFSGSLGLWFRFIHFDFSPRPKTLLGSWVGMGEKHGDDEYPHNSTDNRSHQVSFPARNHRFTWFDFGFGSDDYVLTKRSSQGVQWQSNHQWGGWISYQEVIIISFVRTGFMLLKASKYFQCFLQEE